MEFENVYKACPEYETKLFTLKKVRLEDAEDLMVCYSDPKVAEKVNKDFCTSDFYYTRLEQMEDCIRFWLKEYHRKAYVRFAVIPKKTGKAVGTVEIFGGENGVLRMDLASSYDNETCVEELLHLAVFKLIRDFQIGSMKIKASNTPERIPMLVKYGFVPAETFRPGLGYYERPADRYFNPDKGFAYCGLACCVCSENRKCAGCQKGGCKERSWCQNYNCCEDKGLEGCWQCKGFPCSFPMLGKLRVRTFAKFIALYGAECLMAALQKHEQNGILYHHKGQLTGDYDLLLSEEEIFNFLKKA